MPLKIHRSFECNLLPGTSYRSDKRIHFSNNQFLNGILTWFAVIPLSETCELFWAIFAFTTPFSSWSMVYQSKNFFTTFSTKWSQQTLPIVVNKSTADPAGSISFKQNKHLKIFLGSTIWTWTYLKILFSLKLISKETSFVPKFDSHTLIG